MPGGLEMLVAWSPGSSQLLRTKVMGACAHDMPGIGQARAAALEGLNGNKESAQAGQKRAHLQTCMLRMCDRWA